jgi:hypothetical protein
MSFGFSARTLCLQNTLKKPLIDSVFDKAVLIEDLTDSIKVERHVYWAPPFITKRDMCVLLNKARLDDGTVVLTAKSTKHSQCPEDVRREGQGGREKGGRGA